MKTWATLARLHMWRGKKQHMGKQIHREKNSIWGLIDETAALSCGHAVAVRQGASAWGRGLSHGVVRQPVGGLYNWNVIYRGAEFDCNQAFRHARALTRQMRTCLPLAFSFLLLVLPLHLLLSLPSFSLSHTHTHTHKWNEMLTQYLLTVNPISQTKLTGLFFLQQVWPLPQSRVHFSKHFSQLPLQREMCRNKELK